MKPKAEWDANPFVWVVHFVVMDARAVGGIPDNQREVAIIFSAAMVRALLAGKKTQTRRIVKETRGADQIVWCEREPMVPPPGTYTGWAGRVFKLGALHLPLECPYKVGDRLWVREGVRRALDEHGKPAKYGAQAKYIADGAVAPIDHWGWKNKALPAIHMPRGVCRLLLAVVGVRCERVQSITEADAKAEGAPMYVVGHGSIDDGELQAEPGYWAPNLYRNGFQEVWRGIHG